MNTETLLSKDEVVEWLQDQLCCMKRSLSLSQKFKASTTDSKEDWGQNIEDHKEAILRLKSTLHYLDSEDDNRPYNPIFA